jgi:hypothetical protein
LAIHTLCNKSCWLVQCALIIQRQADLEVAAVFTRAFTEVPSILDFQHHVTYKDNSYTLLRIVTPQSKVLQAVTSGYKVALTNPSNIAYNRW